MKKYILLIILFLGASPCLKHGKFSISLATKVYADEFGEEDSGDPCDPFSDSWDPALCEGNDDPDDPNDPPPPPPPCDIEEGAPETTYFTSGGYDFTVTCIDYTDCWGTDLGQDCTRDSTAVACSLDGVSLSASPGTASSGQHVTLTASPSVSGSPTVTYKFQVMNEFDSWTDIGNGTSHSCDYVMDDDGETNFQVIATGDCGGGNTTQATASAVVNEGISNCVNSATLALSSTSGNINDAITLTASSNLPSSANVTYEFQEFDSVDGWIDITTTTSNSITYIIDQGGESPFRVRITNSCGDETSDEEDFMAPECITGAQLTLSSNSGVGLTNVILTATSTASPGTVVNYEFQIYNNGNWDDLQNSTNPNYTYTIDEASTRFRVIETASCMSSNSGVTSSESVFTETCGVNSVALALSNYSGNYHDNVLLTASADVVGTPNLTYSFQVLDNGIWVQLQNSSNPNYTYTIDEPVTNFKVVIGGTICGTTAYTDKESNQVTFNENCSVGSVALSLSNTTGGYHTDVVLTGAADGDPTNLTYKFQMLNNGSWVDLQNSSNPNYTYTIDEAQTYFRVIAQANCAPTPISVTSATGVFNMTDDCSFTTTSSNVAITEVPATTPLPPTYYGQTTESDLTIDFGACSSNGVWKLVIKSVNGLYTHQTAFPPGVQEIIGQTNASNYGRQMLGLALFGNSPAAWYTMPAVDAHEAVHYGHLLSLLQQALPSIEALFTSYSVTDNGQSESTAVTQLKAAAGYTDTGNSSIRTSAFNLWAVLMDAAIINDHVLPNGPARQAEATITVPMGYSIYLQARNSGW